MFKFFSLFFLTLSLFAQEPDFGKYDGAAVISDLNSSKRVVFGKRADERLSPCSTFKILNSMIALDVGVIKDENETIKWDGVIREYPAWNQDHSMRSAIAVSAVWFYQELAKRVGKEQMQGYVEVAHYGNADTSETLSDFWLAGGSLKISLNEQVDFLSRLLKNDLLFSRRAINTTKDILTLEKKKNYRLVGKTGSCQDVGWFVGYMVKHSKTIIFAFNIKGRGASGLEAKKIALKYLKSVK